MNQDKEPDHRQSLRSLGKALDDTVEYHLREYNMTWEEIAGALLSKAMDMRYKWHGEE